MTGTLDISPIGTPEKTHYRIPGENYFESMTPLFRYEQVMNEHRSLKEGREVFDLLEVVEFRLAGTNQYKPVFPVDAVYRTVNGRPITFAERWSDEYRNFLDGQSQNASGTPLEELKPYGATPAQLSICRALNIYSIEAVEQLTGANLKRLSGNGNALKEMAARWRAARQDSNPSSELEELRARIAELEGRNVEAEGEVEDVEDEAEEIDETVFDTLSDDDLKGMIADIAGSKPRGNPSRSTLIAMLRELQGNA